MSCPERPRKEEALNAKQQANRLRELGDSPRRRQLLVLLVVRSQKSGWVPGQKDKLENV